MDTFYLWKGWYPLRKKSPYLELFWSAFSRIFRHSDCIRRDTVSVRIQSECGKIREKWRTRITSNTALFTPWSCLLVVANLSYWLSWLDCLFAFRALGLFLNFQSNNILIGQKFRSDINDDPLSDHELLVYVNYLSVFCSKSSRCFLLLAVIPLFWNKK